MAKYDDAMFRAAIAHAAGLFREGNSSDGVFEALLDHEVYGAWLEQEFPSVARMLAQAIMDAGWREAN